MQAFVNAISAALAWLGKASTDDIVSAVPPEYYAGDRALYRAMIESNRERVSPDGRISPEAAQITYRNLATFEDTMKNAKIDLAKTYDNSFVERALSAAGTVTNHDVNSDNRTKMKLSTDRILTTHVGSLPRPDDLFELMLDAHGRQAGRRNRLCRCASARRSRTA